MFVAEKFAEQMMGLVTRCHAAAVDKGFWDDPNWNFGEKVALIHSELSEALEADRRGGDTESEKAPGHTLVAEEFADVVIRICDLCGKLGIDLGQAILAKMEYNATRPPKHGKAY